MIQTCAKCSRVNPSDAVYCYHDGFVLGGHNRAGGPVAVGSMPFNSPFVFPDGHMCRSFNELARACNQRWPEAREMLQKGLLESFLTGLGRFDLVQAAQEARKFPDPDRALDQLLARLPCDKEALAPPQLKLETQEINLGVIEPGVDRQLEIHLENLGERLLYGDVAVRVPGKQQVWISLDNKPGTTERSFQFQEKMVLRVHLDRGRVRASDKPLVATLAFDTSGGEATIQIKAEVPVKPFTEGVLSGAKSPRRVAELAKVKPKDAAPLFESGAVAAWYKSNGWEYPVQGPPASGLGAVQQFFEALGLAPAPKVRINTKRIEWSAAVGSTLEQEIILETPEKKYIYAHGVADQPWVEPGRAELKGPRATIKVRVPSVPDKPGETLTATLSVQSNGDQRFLIPITLAIAGTPRRVEAPVSSNPFAFGADEDEPATVVAVAEEEETVPVVSLVAEKDLPAAPVVAVVEAAPDVAGVSDVATVEVVDSPGEDQGSFDFGGTNTPSRTTATRREEPAPRTRPEPVRRGEPEREEKPRSRSKGGSGGFLGHLAPLGVLLVAFALLAAWDYLNPEVRSGASVSDMPTLELIFNKMNSRYALEVFDPLDRKNAEKRKALFPTPIGVDHPSGNTGNVCVRFGGSGKNSTEYLFGNSTPGIATRRSQVALPAPRKGWRTVYYYDDFKVEVTQEVELVHGPSDALDTCVVRYIMENKGTNKQMVGLRVLLDTYIGTNDGVPFTIPGESGFVTTRRILNQKEVPQYLEAIENPEDPKNPGTAARIGLRFPDSDLDTPVKVVICGYQNGFHTQKWDVDPIKDIGKDSCVLIYWADTTLNKGERREVGYSYGLGEVQGDGRLALSAPGVVTPNSEFVLTSYIHKAEKGQTFTVLLPPGVELAKGESAEKTVAADAERVTLSWRLQAGEASKTPLPIKVEGAGTTSRPVRVQVRVRSIFG